MLMRWSNLNLQLHSIVTSFAEAVSEFEYDVDAIHNAAVAVADSAIVVGVVVEMAAAAADKGDVVVVVADTFALA
jgi:3-isopropylmalate dehydratase small subunit